MGKLLASLAVIIVAAAAAFFTFTSVSNASFWRTTYTHVFKDAAGTPFAGNQPGVLTATGYNSQLTFPGPLAPPAVPNFGSVYLSSVPPSWKLASGSSIPITTGTAASGGIAMGNLTSIVSLGLFNGGCANILTVPIDLYNATTDTTDTIEWLSDGSNTTGDVDPVSFPGDVPNGVPAEADHYPTYINTIFDVDGPGGVQPPLRPYARLYGQVTVAAGNAPTHLTLVIFNADQFQNMAGLVSAGFVNPQDDLSDSYGYMAFVILNNPTQPAAPTSITDFCSQLVSTTDLTATTNGELTLTGPNLCADTVNNDPGPGGPDVDTKVNDGCPVQGIPEEATGAGALCDNALDDDGDGWPNDGCNKSGTGLVSSGEQMNECLGNFADGADQDLDGVIDDGCIKRGSTVGPAASRGEKCGAPILDDDADGTTDEGCGFANIVTPAAGKGVLGTDTYILRSMSIAQREAADGDSIENPLDPCPLTHSGTWDPRSFGPTNDTDGDGLDDSCDPAIGVAGAPAGAACAGAAGFPDEDQDCFPNRGDNCPLVWNGDNPNTPRYESQENFDVPFGRVVGDGGNRDDGIGSACEMAVAASGAAESGDQCRADPADGVGEGLDDDGDTVPDDGCGYDNDNDGAVNEDDKDLVPFDDDGDTLKDEDPADDWDGDGSTADEAATPGGVTNRSQQEAQGLGDGSSAANAKATHTHKSIALSAVCLSTSVDTDLDGWCDATETLLGSVGSPAGAPALASRPENIAIVLGNTDSGPAEQVCNDTLDNDGDTTVDGADAGCTAAPGDTDGDGVLDATDGCDSGKNPDQLNTDADVETPPGIGGDECDIDDDGDTLVDVQEYARGTNPKIVNTSGIGTNDRTNTLVMLCTNATDDDYRDSAENPTGNTSFINDGCPTVGVAETAGANCADALDNDTDGRINDGCATVGTLAEQNADNDGDGTADGVEMVIGTNPNSSCSSKTGGQLGQPAWPLDIDNSRGVTVADVLEFKGRSPAVVDNGFVPAEFFNENRLDMDGSGAIAVADVLKYKGVAPASCFDPDIVAIGACSSAALNVPGLCEAGAFKAPWAAAVMPRPRSWATALLFRLPVPNPPCTLPIPYPQPAGGVPVNPGPITITLPAGAGTYPLTVDDMNCAQALVNITRTVRLVAMTPAVCPVAGAAMAVFTPEVNAAGWSLSPNPTLAGFTVTVPAGPRPVCVFVAIVAKTCIAPTTQKCGDTDLVKIVIR